MAGRLSLDKIVDLYKTSPVFQDLLETSAATALAAGGQAVMTDMTPEQIAIASAAGFGAGMIGRPVMGRAGQAIGGVLDKKYPGGSATFLEGLQEGKASMPKAMQELYDAKMAPYQHLGGFGQYGNLIGRGYGDNVAQLAVALAAPGIFGEENNA